MIMMMMVVVMKIEYFLPASKNHIPPFPNQPG